MVDGITETRIVAAAKCLGDMIVTGVRHGDNIMNRAMGFYIEGNEIIITCIKLSSYFLIDEEDGTISLNPDVKSGFVTNEGKFVDRTEGWVIARNASQIIYDTINNVFFSSPDKVPEKGTLFSENLW